MTEVLHSPSSSSSPSISTPTPHNNPPTLLEQLEGEEEENKVREKRESDRRDQLSLLALLVAIFRKSFWLNCKTDRDSFNSAAATGGGGGGGGGGAMEIGWPTDVQHVNHVTFDRFDGFLGLPVEFEPEVPRRAPSASTTVFGVSTESMQLSYDIRGNSIPTILLLMQRHLYSLRGLQAEGIFRITAGNSQEEYVRDQLNRGIVPEGIDVHCLAGLIKAWFRELPRGVLDSLSPEQVMQCQSEEDCEALVRVLPPTESALLNWAINLMVDVIQEERLNKMNSRNIAMVFAPNMTQRADPLTALMYAVQVMNFLKILIEKTSRERQDSIIEPSPLPHTDPSDENGHQGSPQILDENPEDSSEKTILPFMVEDPDSDCESETNQVNDNSDEDYLSYSASAEESDESEVYRVSIPREGKKTEGVKNERGKTVKSHTKTESRSDNMNKGVSNLSRINSMTERFEEAWR